ncbi:MAG: LolA family protein, partial [Aurantibacter sp.]
KAGIYWTFFLAFFVFSSLAAQTKMDGYEAEALRTKVKSLAQTTETVTSDFIQYKHLDFLSNDFESKGKLSFKSPDLVKWEYISPFAYSVLFKADMLYINNEGDKSDVDIGSNKLFKQLNKLISASVTGDMFNTEEFNISYFIKGNKSEVRFSSKDKKLAKYIKEFHIVFNAKAEVSEVKMIEPSDDYTHIVFSNRTVNQALPDAVFTH